MLKKMIAVLLTLAVLLGSAPAMPLGGMTAAAAGENVYSGDASAAAEDVPLPELEFAADSQSFTSDGEPLVIETADDAVAGDGLMATGYVPDHHVLTSTGNEYDPNAPLYGVLPESYSSVEKGKVTTPKNQNPYGTCWAFSTINCLESSAISNDGASVDDTDFSELHLVYFNFNRPTDPLGLTEGDGLYLNSSDPLDSGGNYSFSSRALTSGVGPVEDSVLSYDRASSDMSFDASLAYADRQMTVENVFEISAGNTDRIKQLVMEYGSAGMSYYHVSTYLNSAGDAYYNNSVTGTNHAVSIVGWDDNYSASNFKTAPAADGAWLIKNSWGNYWGDNGYFWMSYEDMAFQPYSDGTYNTVFVFDATTEVAEDEYIYQYDGGSVNAWTTLSVPSIELAARFTAQRKETVNAASLVIYSDNLDYSLQLYRNPGESNPASGEAILDTPVTGHFTDAGYHTVEIPSSPKIQEGETFSVVFTLVSGQSKILVPLDFSHESGAFSFRTAQSDGQTYLYYYGWRDLANTQNSTARVKAFTTPVNEISGVCGDGLTWTLDDNGLLTISGTGAMYDWTGVANVPWADYNTQIKNVVIEDGVTSIGSSAFQYHTNLESVVIGKDVVSVGKNAFQSNNSLTSVEFLGDKVVSIGDYAFYSCGKLVPFAIPDSVETIGSYAFAYCYGFDKVTLGSGVKSIGDYAFSYCQNMTEIILGNSVESLGEYVFNYCSKLTSINLPDSLSAIGEGAFYYCAMTGIELPEGLSELAKELFHYGKLTSVSVPEGTEIIRERAFYGCGSMTAVYIPKSVKTIEDYAFFLCDGITDVYYYGSEEEWNAITIGAKNDPFINANIHFNYVEIKSSGMLGDNIEWVLYKNGLLVLTGSGEMECLPDWETLPPWATYTVDCNFVTKVIIGDGITSIGDYIFQLSSNLSEIEIPDSVTTIGSHSFQGCESLNNVDLDHVTDIGDGAFCFNEALTSVTLSDSLRTIGDSAFYGTGFSEFIIPESVEFIDASAFSVCPNLTEITIPDKVTSIEFGTFSHCDNLVSVDFGSGVETIDRSVFYESFNLKTVKFGSKLRSIGEDSFESCVNLEDVYFGGNEAQWLDVVIDSGNDPLLNANIHCEQLISGECGDGAYWRIENDTLIIHGDGFIDDFTAENPAPWTEYKEYFTKVDVQIGAYTIGARAFYGCNNIKSVVINEYCSKIGDEAFFACTGMTDVVIEVNDSHNYLETIGKNAFYACTSLSSIDIPEGVVSIGEFAFNNCISLQSVVIPETVKTLGDYCFANCSKMQSVVIPDSVESMGKYCFASNGALTEVSIGTGLTEIPDSAFLQCAALTRIDLSGTNITKIADFAFDYCSKLAEVRLPGKLESIGECAFHFAKITQIDLPYTLSFIGEEAFHHCTELTSISIPEGMTNINYGTFYGCTSLKTVSIPESVNVIEDNAFMTCPAVTDVYYAGSQVDWDKIIIKSNNDSILKANIHCAMGISGECGEGAYWRIEDGVLYLFGDGFMDDFTAEKPAPWIKYKDKFTKVIVEPGCYYVGNRAFYGCSNITSVVVDGFVDDIGDEAFYACTALTDVTFEVFNEVNHLETIGDSAFYACTSLTAITLPEGFDSIGDNAFTSCVKLQSITLPDSVESIGENAFAYCGNLTEVNIGSGLTVIPDNAFLQCGKLTAVDLSETNIKTIGNFAFDYCSDITEIKLPEGLESIGECAFHFAEITEIDLPSSLTFIGEEAFHHCDLLESITIPEQLATISVGAFSGCLSLKTVTIPESVTLIEERAFSSCPEITDVYYAGSELDWYEVVIERLNDDLLNANIHFGKPSFPAPVINAYTFGYTSIKITWNPIEGADGYEIFRCDMAGQPYEYIDSVSAGGDNSYRNIGLSTGSTYYYKVRAYKILDDGREVYGEFSAYSYARPLPATPVVTVNRTSGTTADVSWVKIYGATGYSVYVSNEADGEYTFAANFKSGDTVKYTAVDLLPYKDYYFKVRAYRQMGDDMMFGSYSKPVGVEAVAPAPPAVPEITARSVGYTSAKVLWDTVPGADGYEIFRCDVGGGEYSFVASVGAEATFYTNAGLSTGTTYYFKVRSFAESDEGKLYSELSACATARPIPATPVVKVDSSNASAVTFSWAKIYGATGYSVYRSTEKDGTYSFLGGISSGSTVSYTDKTAKAGQTYYYKVRAYRAVGSDKMFGNYSNAVTVSVK